MKKQGSLNTKSRNHTLVWLKGIEREVNETEEAVKAAI